MKKEKKVEWKSRRGQRDFLEFFFRPTEEHHQAPDILLLFVEVSCPPSGPGIEEKTFCLLPFEESLLD